MMQSSANDNTKATDKKQKYIYTKLDKIEKWMENLMDKLKIHNQIRRKQTIPKTLP